MNRRRELIKNILLVLLALGAAAQVLLISFGGSASRAPLRQRLSALLGQERYRIVYAEEGVSASVAARPVQISVRNSFGRQSVMRDFAALDEAYERFGGLLGEALERCDDRPQTLPTRDYLTALQQPGIYFSYDGALPTSLLASWLGVQTSLEQDVSALLLYQAADGVQLALAMPDGFLCCSTALDAEQLNTALEAHRPDESAFACELAGEPFSRLSGETLLAMTASVSVPAAASAAPFGTAWAQELAIRLGFNPYGNSYTATDGATVYEETTRTLRVQSSGFLALDNTDSAPLYQAADSGYAALCRCASDLLELISQDLPTSARLYLTAVQRTGSSITLCFDYALSGLLIQLSREHAAELTFSGRTLQRAEVQLRSYTLTGDTLGLLPEKVEAAIAPEGSRLRIRYRDTGTDALTAGWFGE